MGTINDDEKQYTNQENTELILQSMEKIYP